MRPSPGGLFFKDKDYTSWVRITFMEDGRVYGYSYTTFLDENEEYVNLQIDEHEKFWFESMHMWERFDIQVYNNALDNMRVVQ